MQVTRQCTPFFSAELEDNPPCFLSAVLGQGLLSIYHSLLNKINPLYETLTHSHPLPRYCLTRYQWIYQFILVRSFKSCEQWSRFTLLSINNKLSVYLLCMGTGTFVLYTNILLFGILSTYSCGSYIMTWVFCLL